MANDIKLVNPIDSIKLGVNIVASVYQGVDLVWGTPISALDADASAFLVAVGITDPTQSDAINQLVVDLKAYGLWVKMYAIYPIVGGTAATHKWNLKDPRDLDVAYRLAPVTGTHDATGWKGGYAFTYIAPNVDLLQDDVHLSYYSRENISGAYVEMGVNGTNSLFIAPNYNGTNYRAVNRAQVSTASANINAQAFFIASRIISTQSKQYRNGIIINTDNLNSSGLQSQYITIHGYGAVGNPAPLAQSQRQCAFASVGLGLTDTDASNLYTAVQTYQTALGRQV